MNNRIFLAIITLSLATGLLWAEAPQWVHHLPFSEDDFWGVGSGRTAEAAQQAAKGEILMQLSSHVEAAISLEAGSSGGNREVDEKVEAFFRGNSLRGAEQVDQFEEGDQIWVLMKYGSECGQKLIKSAVLRYEKPYNYESEKVMLHLRQSQISDAVRVEKRLQELRLPDFKAEDILIRYENRKMVIMIINFLPYETELSQSQTQGLKALGDSLLEELNAIDYRSIRIVGHANPTGKENEAEELNELSRFRARTIESYLRSAGLTIESVSWKGGTETIGDRSTAAGKGLNRRVEIVVEL